MKTLKIFRTSHLIFAALLSACGGGSGDAGSNAGKPVVVAVDTAIKATTAAPNFNFASFKTISLKSSALLAAAAGFTVKNPAKTYVKSWYVDTSNQRQQVMFMTLASLQTQESAGGIKINLPGDVSVLKFEIYDADSNQFGEVYV